MRERDRSTFPTFAVLASLAFAASAGCGRESAKQAVDAQLAREGKQRLAVFPLAGTVMVDGQPPKFDSPERKVVVILYDPAKPTLLPRQRPRAACDADGKFQFRTYGDADGIEAGKFVVLFAALNETPKEGFTGPDALKNRYNDPDKNAAVPEFNINHQSPGKSNYEFHLELAGKPAVDSPGTKAITEVLSGRQIKRKDR